MIIVLNIQHIKNLPIAIINTEEMGQICNIGHTKNKDHDKAGLIRFLPKKAVQKSYIHT